MVDRLKPNSVTSWNLFRWSSLSCQAGFINAGGLLACHRFVTHTTGFATQFGVEFAQKKWIDALGMLTVPIFFLSGSMISAFFVDRKINHNENANYFFLFFLISFLLCIVTTFGEIGFFGQFGLPLDIQVDYALIAILCLVSGIQNAAITTASGAVIRTTHMTGLTTDLGIGIVRMFDSRLQNQTSKQKEEAKANLIRISLIFGFILGSILGSICFINLQYLAFGLPAALSAGLAIWTLRHQRKFRSEENSL